MLPRLCSPQPAQRHHRQHKPGLRSLTMLTAQAWGASAHQVGPPCLSLSTVGCAWRHCTHLQLGDSRPCGIWSWEPHHSSATWRPRTCTLMVCCSWSWHSASHPLPANAFSSLQASCCQVAFPGCMLDAACLVWSDFLPYFKHVPDSSA